MIEKTFNIQGMSCKACALSVQKCLLQIPGVIKANANLLNNSVYIQYQDDINLNTLVYELKKRGYTLLINQSKFTKIKVPILSLSISIILSITIMLISMLSMHGINIISNIYLNLFVQFLLSFIVLVINYKILFKGISALFYFKSNMDTLVSIGALSSFLYSCFNIIYQYGTINDMLLLHESYFESSAIILSLVKLGRFFETKAKIKTTKSIDDLIAALPNRVRKLMPDNSQALEDISNIAIGDIICIKQGDYVPLDGIIIQGYGLFDQSSITGESLGVLKNEGQEVISSSILQKGFVLIKVTKIGANTTINQIIELIKKAQVDKSKISKVVDTISYYFVPAVILISISCAIYWYIQGAVFFDILRFSVSILLVSCPCALGLAVPTALMVSSSLMAKNGVLFKDSQALEGLYKASAIIFDKTGTLTYGKFSLIKHINYENTKEYNLNLAKALESLSSHPLSMAFLNEKTDSFNFKAYDYEYENLLGISALIDNCKYYLGNKNYLLKILKNKIIEKDIFEDKKMCTLYLFTKDTLLSAFVLGDELKDDAKGTIAYLHNMGKRVIMLTGDGKVGAKAVALECNISEYKYNCTALDKYQYIQQLQKQGHKVLFIGDGLNDAISLTQADFSIGINGACDLALSSCNIVFMKNSLINIVNALKISKLTMVNIKQNLFWAFVYNLITIPLAGGLFYNSFNLSLNPQIAAFLMSMSSLCVLANALRLNLFKNKIFKFEKIDQGATMHNYSVLIEGMSCNHCTNSVNKALSKIEGIDNIKVSLTDKCASFSSDKKLDENYIKNIIEDLDFKVISIK